MGNWPRPAPRWPSGGAGFHAAHADFHAAAGVGVDLHARQLFECIDRRVHAHALDVLPVHHHQRAGGHETLFERAAAGDHHLAQLHSRAAHAGLLAAHLRLCRGAAQQRGQGAGQQAQAHAGRGPHSRKARGVGMHGVQRGDI
jgi:hypothetical protein